MSWTWSNFKLRTKLFFGFFYFFIFYLILQTVVQYDFAHIEREASEYTVLKGESDILYAELSKQNLNLFKGMVQVNSEQSIEQLMSARSAININRSMIQKMQEHFKSNVAYAALSVQYNSILDLMGNIDLQIGLINSDIKNNTPVLSLNLVKMNEVLTQLSLQTIELAKANTDLTEIFQKQMGNRLEKSKMGMYIIGTAGILIVGLLILFIAISIRNSALKVQRFALHLVNGELWAKPLLNSKDEFGLISNELDNVRLKMREVLLSINESTKGMLAASHEFSSGSSIISSGASEQAAASAEISSTMDVVAEGIKEASNKAVATSVIAQQAYLEVEGGVKKVSEAAEVIKIIAHKNKIIGEISYQTKILSINASVEAARAAEYGRGFAVVAEEVKRLAEDTQFSATEISEVSKRGVNLSNESAAMLNAIVPHIKETAVLIDSIGQMGTDHIVGIEQISRSIQELNNVIQQNAASSEELASSSEELVRTVESLRDQVSFFKFEKEESEETIDEVAELEEENTNFEEEENDISSFQSWSNEPEAETQTAEIEDDFETWLKKRKYESVNTSNSASKYNEGKKYQMKTSFDDNSYDMINIRPFAASEEATEEENPIRYPVVDEPKINLPTSPKPEPDSKKETRKIKTHSDQTKSGVRINLSDNDDFDSQFERIK